MIVKYIQLFGFGLRTSGKYTGDTSMKKVMTVALIQSTQLNDPVGMYLLGIRRAPLIFRLELLFHQLFVVISSRGPVPSLV